jgi:hypothetical protein
MNCAPTFKGRGNPSHTAGNFMPDLKPRLEALIVLGARLNPQGQPGRVARLRLLHALDLWQGHCPQGFMIITGGRTSAHPRSEAAAMSEWLLAWVDDHRDSDLQEQLHPCLLLEETSLNTAASARHCLSLVQKLGLTTVGLVSDAFHMPRAQLLFRRHFVRHGIRIRPLPAPGLVRHYWSQRRYLWLAKMALREAGAWTKLLARRLTGY